MHSWSNFNAWTNHEHTRTHKIHHGPNLGEATTFPLILFYVISHVGYIQMSFFRDSQVESLEILKIGTPATLKAHNFLCKHSIEVRSKTKLYLSFKSFKRYVACHLHAHISSRFLIFSGWKSNWHFDSRPFFWHNCIISIQMDHENWL